MNSTLRATVQLLLLSAPAAQAVAEEFACRRESFLGKGNNADRFSDRDFVALSVTQKF